MLTVGVEEEFLLVDPDGGLVPAAADVVRAAADPRVKPELMTYQLETATGVCADLAGLEAELVQLRHAAAAACERVGVRLVAVGAPPMDAPGLEYVTGTERYRGLATAFPEAVGRGGTCACQVHVGVADRELAVRVLGRLRTWLPAVFSLGTNSPVSLGRDTGWSSARYVRQLQWPTFTPPGTWADAAAYDRAVQGLVDGGAAFDLRSVYLMARLSPRYPTIEIRVADTSLEVADTVLLAGVCRALVTVLIEEERRGGPDLPVSEPALRSALLAVALDGWPPSTCPSEVSRTLGVARLLRAILPGIEGSAEADVVLGGLERVNRLGTGADRQRRLLASAPDRAGFVSALAAATLGEGTS